MHISILQFLLHIIMLDAWSIKSKSENNETQQH